MRIVAILLPVELPADHIELDKDKCTLQGSWNSVAINARVFSSGMTEDIELVGEVFVLDTVKCGDVGMADRPGEGGLVCYRMALSVRETGAILNR